MLKTNCPLVAVDVVVFSLLKDLVLLIERKNPPLGHALPGGFVEKGEWLWQTARRELKEETGLEGKGLDPHPIGIWQDPKRDKRDHIISVGFVCISKMLPVKGMDDAKKAEWWNLERVMNGEVNLVVDHMDILIKACRKYNLDEYIEIYKKRAETNVQNNGLPKGLRKSS